MQMNRGLAAAAQGHDRAVRLLDGDMVDFSADCATQGASCIQMPTRAIIEPPAVKDVAVSVGETIMDSLSDEEPFIASRFQAAGADIGNRETSGSTKAPLPTAAAAFSQTSLSAALYTRHGFLKKYK